MLFNFFRNRRRRRWLAAPVPSEWKKWLESNVWQYRQLDETLQAKVQRVVCVLFHEKDWAGGGNLTVTDEMRVTIAGQAALATLGFEKSYYFDRLQTIIVYPSIYTSQPTSSGDLILGELGNHAPQFEQRAGESWQGGPIVLAWDAVLKEGRQAKSRRCVVLHEFAHHMDGLDGATDGAPPLTDYEFEKRWYRVTEAEYLQLLEFSRRGQRTLLDPYGATNQAEFFAVATECFFTQPHELAEQHAELFAVLERLFGQDPREWMQ